MESDESKAGRDAEITRLLLRCGVWAGPFYLTVGLAQTIFLSAFTESLGRDPSPARP